MRLKLLLSLGIILSIAILGTPTLQRSLGYFPGAPGWKVAEIAAQKQNVELCNRIIDLPWSIFSMGPSSNESSILCIHEYAKLTKDPSACELLMPSEYGLSCVGAATKNMPCLFDDQRNVIWNDGVYHEIPYDECSKSMKSDMGNICCQAAASRFDPGFTEGCAQFRTYDPLLADYCQYEVALKEAQPDFCEQVKDKNVRAACGIETKALRDYPELRRNYPFIKKSSP